MDSYKQLYFHLFNAITDAIGDLKKNDPATALLRLAQAQQQTEEWYMDSEEAGS